MTTDKAMTPEAPMDSPPMSAPMTPEEVRDAREFIARWVDADTEEYPHTVGSRYKLLARYARELERHAEAMANAWEAGEMTRGDYTKLVAAYRTQFPRTDEDGR
jgi:hypothetical protein